MVCVLNKIYRAYAVLLCPMSINPLPLVIFIIYDVRWTMDNGEHYYYKSRTYDVKRIIMKIFYLF